jgi:hypothetical protein
MLLCNDSAETRDRASIFDTSLNTVIFSLAHPHRAIYINTCNGIFTPIYT